MNLYIIIGAVVAVLLIVAIWMLWPRPPPEYIQIKVGPNSYNDAKNFAAAKGRKIANSKQVLEYVNTNIPVFEKIYGPEFNTLIDLWIAVSDSENEWVQAGGAGNTTHKRGLIHSTLGFKPNWTNGPVSFYAGVLLV